jgi:hypothetical protein
MTSDAVGAPGFVTTVGGFSSVAEDVPGELDEERVVIARGRVGLVVPGVRGAVGDVLVGVDRAHRTDVGLVAGGARRQSSRFTYQTLSPKMPMASGAGVRVLATSPLPASAAEKSWFVDGLNS